MLKIGVFGTGHLGKIHINCIQQLSEIYDLIGFYDPDEQIAKMVSEKFGIPAFSSENELLEKIDVADIVAPTTKHFEIAANAIKQKKHLFIEKPVTHTLAEAEGLKKLIAEFGVKLQVGHVERFNPALLSVQDLKLNPMFVEAHRLAQFNPRGTDVSVILDLMIHDLDILLSVVESKVKSVNASGVAIVSHSPDIANARIEFENGCVANLTASRMSLKQMRKIRMFQPDAYISLDFLDKKAQIVRLFESDEKEGKYSMNSFELETATGKKKITIEMPDIQPVNAIQEELKSFAKSIEKDETPVVSLEDGYRALKVAYEIIEQIKERTKKAIEK